MTVRGEGRGGRCAEFLLSLAVELDGRADVYALGVVLYQALTGALPWRVPAAEESAQPPPARSAQPVSSVPGADREPAPLPPIPGLPAEVAELCLRCLRADPAARPSSARLARRLARSVRLKTVVVDPPTGSTEAADDAPAAASGPASIERGAAPATSAPVLATAATGATPRKAAAHRRAAGDFAL